MTGCSSRRKAECVGDDCVWIVGKGCRVKPATPEKKKPVKKAVVTPEKKKPVKKAVVTPEKKKPSAPVKKTPEERPKNKNRRAEFWAYVKAVEERGDFALTREERKHLRSTYIELHNRISSAIAKLNFRQKVFNGERYELYAKDENISNFCNVVLDMGEEEVNSFLKNAHHYIPPNDFGFWSDDRTATDYYGHEVRVPNKVSETFNIIDRNLW